MPKEHKEYNCFEKSIVRTSTNIFREDLNWVKFVKYISSHFMNKEKVNVYSLASSDGSEAYTFAISVMDNVKKNLQPKFFPIIASDIDEEIIKTAKSGRINLLPLEFFFAEKTCGVNLSKYFEEKGVSLEIIGDNISDMDHISSYKPIKSLKDSVEFKQSDILTELKNIKDDGNSVIMIRNVFPYLNKEYTDEVITQANKSLKKGSLFVIGDYDEKKNIGENLLKNGFFNPIINENNIFQRGSSREFTDLLNSGYLI